nr:class D sortase [Fontibacillus panacisegetis]
MVRNKIPYILILLGLLIMLTPKLLEWKADYEQNQLLEDAEQLELTQESVRSNTDIQRSYAQVSTLLDQGEEEESVAIEPLEEVNGETPIAVIEIDKIDLKLPVLEGATKENMRHAATHMSDTTPLGEVGNAAIAAHRARKEGRLFNRLDEVELGDLVKITTKREKYTYKVIKISVVEPTDISVLNSNNNDKWLTLITCTPLNKSTHRLIVQAELEE